MPTGKTIEQKIHEGRSYRTVRSFSAVVTEPDDRQIVQGYATTFLEPYELFSYDDSGYRIRFMEQVDPSAFRSCDMSDVIMQYDHEGRVFARVSNGTLRLATDDHGLHIEADLGGTETGRQLYEEIKGGYIQKMSFGFKVSEDTRTEARDEATKTITITRTITGISKLWDVSAVSLPANDGTEITARSYCDGVIAELTEEHRKAEIQKQQRKRIIILTEV